MNALDDTIRAQPLVEIGGWSNGAVRITLWMHKGYDRPRGTVDGVLEAIVREGVPAAGVYEFMPGVFSWPVYIEIAAPSAAGRERDAP